MKRMVIALVLALMVLHQDFWNWHTHQPMILGFIPIGLAWHVGLSLAAGVLSWLMVTYCWPVDVDVLEKSATHESTRLPRN